MREKILKALKKAGHGMTVHALEGATNSRAWPMDWGTDQMVECCKEMEQDKLLILHRSTGSAGVSKGEVVLVCLRPEGH